MDKSETYIKMCDCPKIQKERKKGFIEGDYIANYMEEWELVSKDTKKARKVLDGIVIYMKYTAILNKELAVFLPRQDQIQETIRESHRCNKCLLERIFNFATSDLIDESMEKLWLKFYMHEEHKKIWNGKEWIKK